MCEIETDRLHLRMFRTHDLDELALIFSDPEVVRHLGTGQPATRAESRVALQSVIQHWHQHGYGRWAAVYKPTQKLIGYCGLRNFNGTPELVYLLSKQYWGLGLATEMAETSLRYGFTERNFDRIIAMTKLANLASRRVMEKLRMSYERNAIIYDMEVACYSISRSEYLSGRGECPAVGLASPGALELDAHFNYPPNPSPRLLSPRANEAKMASR